MGILWTNLRGDFSCPWMVRTGASKRPMIDNSKYRFMIPSRIGFLVAVGGLRLHFVNLDIALFEFPPLHSFDYVPVFRDCAVIALEFRHQPRSLAVNPA